MHRTRVKICGITRIEDMRTAVAEGADAIGLVFYPSSPRAVTAQQAAQIVAQTPAFVTIVGLFVDPQATDVEQVLSQVPLDMLQFHGDETAAFCQSFQRPYIKALRMKDDIDLHHEKIRYASARSLLVDAYVPGTPGGTGEHFDWSRLPLDLTNNLILAGGLQSKNIAEAIRVVKPWAVDVSGGVEERDDDGSVLGGIKSAAAIKAFIRGVNSV